MCDRARVCVCVSSPDSEGIDILKQGTTKTLGAAVNEDPSEAARANVPHRMARGQAKTTHNFATKTLATPEHGVSKSVFPTGILSKGRV